MLAPGAPVVWWATRQTLSPGRWAVVSYPATLLPGRWDVRSYPANPLDGLIFFSAGSRARHTGLGGAAHYVWGLLGAGYPVAGPWVPRGRSWVSDFSPGGDLPGDLPGS